MYLNFIQSKTVQISLIVFFFNLIFDISASTGRVWLESRIERDQFINPFPNKPWFLRVSGQSLLKTL